MPPLKGRVTSSAGAAWSSAPYRPYSPPGCQPWHCCHLGPHNSLLGRGLYWGMFSSIPSWIPVAPPTKMSPDSVKCLGGGMCVGGDHPWLRPTVLTAVPSSGRSPPPQGGLPSLLTWLGMLRPPVVPTGPGSMSLPSQPRAHLRGTAR